MSNIADRKSFTRDLEILGSFDVVVCGGGPAGFCAAIQAARGGAKTALVEKSGSLGGTATTGGNPQVALFYAHGRQIISGIGWEAMQRLKKLGYAKIPDFSATEDHSVLGVDVDPFMMAKLMDDMCIEAGVKLFLFHNVCDAIKQTSDSEGDKLAGVVVNTKQGLKVIEGKVFVDCTGDGDLSALSGADFELGEKNELGEIELQPGTLRFFLSGFELDEIDPQQARESFETAMENNEVVRDDFWPKGASPYIIFKHNGNNINHITFNSADSESRTSAEIEGRKSVARILAWAKKYVKGAENTKVVYCAPEVASRESRRIMCDHKITADEYISARSYHDGICYSFYPIDLHKAGHESLDNVFLEKGRVPSIPLSAMTVKGFGNLLVAGRCAYGDRLAHSAFRVKASCMAMGQAAGAAAFIASDRNQGIRQTDIKEIKEFLRKNGAIVPGM